MSEVPSGEQRPSLETRAGLRAPQFRLRTLMLAISGICLLLAATKFMSPIAIGVAVLMLLSVAAHVAGNAIGTQLRDSGSQPLTGGIPGQSSAKLPKRGEVPASVGRASRLSHREAIGFVIIPCVVVGALIGALGGGFWLVEMLHDKFTWPKLLFGASACAVLGGILGFLLSTFVKVLVAANIEAWRDP